MDKNKRRQMKRAFRKYGKDTCKQAWEMHTIYGYGASGISYELQGVDTTTQADAAIEAWRTYIEPDKDNTNNLSLYAMDLIEKYNTEIKEDGLSCYIEDLSKWKQYKTCEDVAKDWKLSKSDMIEFSRDIVRSLGDNHAWHVVDGTPQDFVLPYFWKEYHFSKWVKEYVLSCDIVCLLWGKGFILIGEID